MGKIAGFGCLGAVGLIVVVGAFGALAGGGDDATGKVTASSPAAKDDGKGGTKDDAKGATKADPDQPSKKAAKPEVVFTVWGTAPSGALGPLDITYGSDSDSREGHWKNGRFTTSLPLDGDALYYTVTAQLQGSGDINCSVTIDGHTEKAHAAGGYNICHAQANRGLFGGWG
ncbi:hypothetical protein ACFZAU_18935 [Streptomyces sp. NPDC008238]